METTISDDGRRALDRAREVLAEPYGADVMDLAKRVGALEWHLREMIALAERLGGAA